MVMNPMVQLKSITLNKSKEGKTKKTTLNLDLPKGAEWMIRGAYTPSFRINQHPLEDAGIQIHF